MYPCMPRFVLIKTVSLKSVGLLIFFLMEQNICIIKLHPPGCILNK